MTQINYQNHSVTIGKLESRYFFFFDLTFSLPFFLPGPLWLFSFFWPFSFAAVFLFFTTWFLGWGFSIFLSFLTLNSGMVKILVFTKPSRISLANSFFTAWRFSCVCL